MLRVKTTSGVGKKIPVKTTSGIGKKIPVRSSAVIAPPTDPLAYALAASAMTSAGVFNGETLVRTLWAGQTKDAGSYSTENLWDGKDDAGTEVANGNYTLRVRTNNLSAEAEGTVGNTSAEKSGPTIFHSGEHFTAMTTCDGFAYVGCGYVEGRGGHMKFALSDPQRRILLSQWPYHGQVIRYMDYDATKVYWCGQFPRDDNDPGTDFGIVATTRTTDATATLVGGASKFVPGSPNGTTYSSAVFHRDEPIYGFSVQKTGNFYAFALRDINVVRVYNKTTGATQDFSITAARDICFSGDDAFLWITSSTNTVAKYSIASGVINTTPVLTLSGLVNPNGISISPSDGTVAVLDSFPRHQVRFFHPTTGTEGTALGVSGGYAASPDVTDYKFHFINIKKLHKTALQLAADYGAAIPFLNYLPDGSLAVGDIGNYRMIFYLSNLTYDKMVAHAGFNYVMQVDINNPQRVFIGYVEYEIDYTKTFGPDTGAWKHKRNWAYYAQSVLSGGLDDQYFRMRDVVTLSNGRTYCMARNGTGMVILELASTGLRNTGVTYSSLIYQLHSDGSVWSVENTGIGQQPIFKRRPLTGFDGSNNPQFGSVVTMQTMPTLTGKDPIPSGTRRNQVSSSGVVFAFNSEIQTASNNKNDGYHLGALKNNQYLWKVSDSTRLDYVGDYPPDGWFENGNSPNTGGNVMQVVNGNLIFFGQHQEGWKNGQANKYNVYYEDGLFLYQYGRAIADSDSADYGESPLGMAGNAANGTWVPVSGSIYHYHCDEFFRGGATRWKITGASSVQAFDFPITKSGTITLPAKPGIDLMAGLPYGGVVTDGLAGWNRTPATEGPQGNLTRWTMTTNRLSYHRDERDVYIDARVNATGQTQTVTRSLGTNNLTIWQLAGTIAWPELTEQQNNILEILDDAGLVIVRVRREWLSSTTFGIKANTTTIVSGLNNVMKYQVRYLTPFTIQRSGANLLVTYAGVTITVSGFDGSANLSKPTTLRVTFNNATGTYGHVIGLGSLRFYTN